MHTLRIALAQINSTVGDIAGNTEKIIEAIEKARNQEVQVVVFPELAVTGYPPEDLVLRTDFIDENHRAMDRIRSATGDIAAVVGFIEEDSHIYNSSAFIYDRRIYGTQRKSFLPNYGVFDEKRYFYPAREISTFSFGRTVFGINICEDIWYPDGPAAAQAVAGAGIILNLNASPYHAGKWKQRERMISTRAADNAVYLIYVNSVGGQDELIFEGGSMVFAPDGSRVAQGAFFEEDLLVVDLEPDLPFRVRLHDLRLMERASRCRGDRKIVHHTVPVSRPAKVTSGATRDDKWRQMSTEEEIYSALVLGIHDYVKKNRFHQVALGISGGIDSALVAALACEALGPENVTGIFMPTRYTSEASREDAQKLSKSLGFNYLEIPIDKTFQGYLDMLAPVFADREPDITEENLQARIRGNILMAYSNKFGHLILTTGNKSEMAVGYATLYGDMAGGFAVIKDISKTMVYQLADRINREREVIPERIISRPPSAELKDNQKDSDSLPPYDVLDPILAGLIEEDRDLEEIISSGYDPATVRKVAGLVHRSEYKRRQAPPGIKITARSFGRDRRIPITNGFVSFS